MNVNLDEFLIVSRVNHIFKTLNSSEKDTVPDNIRNCSWLIPTNGNIRGLEDITIYNMKKSLEFLLDSALEGFSVTEYVVLTKRAIMHDVTICECNVLDDEKKIQKMKFGVVLTTDGVYLVSPFPCDKLVSTYDANNRYTVKLLDFSTLHQLTKINKNLLLQYAFQVNEDGETLSDRIITILRGMMDVIVPTVAYLSENMGNVTEANYKVVSRDSDEYEYAKSHFDLSTNSISDKIEDEIKDFDFREILVSDSNTYKVLATKTKIEDSKIVTSIESYEEIEAVFDTTNVVNTEILVDCPTDDIPSIIKLPKDLCYVSYNKVIRTTDNTMTSYELIDLRVQPLLPDEYLEPKEELIETVAGTEAINVREVISDSAKNMMYNFKKIGITTSSKLYEIIYPIAKLPNKIAREALHCIYQFVKPSARLEKQQADAIMEQALNDQLDPMLARLDIIFQTVGIMASSIFLIGNVFLGVIFWKIFNKRNKRIYRKSLERVERRIVTKIREYEQKIEFATQESDYEAVKKLNAVKDSYKEMLDKIREVKSEAIGKHEKYTDTYSEYQ